MTEIENSHWFTDMVDAIDRIEKEMMVKRCLDKYYKILNDLMPKYIGCTPTPPPLDFDIKFCETVKRASDPASSGFADRDWDKEEH